jgi:hypothetical protein
VALEIATHASEQMQKFAPRAQSKTLENFRKITAAGALR